MGVGLEGIEFGKIQHINGIILLKKTNLNLDASIR